MLKTQIANSEFYDRMGERFTEEELEYLCKFWNYDGQEMMAYALGRTEKWLCKKIYKLRKSGQFEYYQNLNKYYL